MYNSFHTALSGGSGRIEDACGESPAASPLWFISLGEVQIIRSFFPKALRAKGSRLVVWGLGVEVVGGLGVT